MVWCLHFPDRCGYHFTVVFPVIMAQYDINKGIGKNVEFKGLQAQYLIIFALGLLAVFFVFVIMYMVNIPLWFCIGFNLLVAFLLVFLTFRLNKKYGQYGLMKLAARKSQPRFIINRKSIYLLFHKTEKNEEYIKSRNTGK